MRFSRSSQIYLLTKTRQKQTVLTARIEIECFIVFLAFDDMFRPVIDFYLLCLILVYSIYCICSVFIVA